MGVIDIFTEYNARKKVEHALRSVTRDPNTISCKPPGFYADRFYRFVSDAFR